MRRILGLLAFAWAFSLFSFAQTSCSTAPPGFYVSPTGSDSNSGTACSPWLTLQHAANVAGAGATVHVEPGTYTQNALTFNNSGTATARILFISDQKWGAKIRSTSSYTVLRVNGSYVDIVGFDVAGDANSCLGIAGWGSNNRIVSNHVHNIPASSTVCGSNGGAGIDHASFTASNNDTIGNTVHDIGSWPTLDARVHGIYHSNLGGHVWNNVVYRSAGFGLHFLHGPGSVTVANNTVFNNVYGGIYVEGTSNMLVTNNIVANNTGYGIIEESGTIGSGDRYLNNLVFNNPKGNILLTSASTQSGTIVADPQFVNYTGGSDGSYALKSTSPARDHGTSTGAPNYDADGGLRPINGVWDLGEFEYGTTPATWPWFGTSSNPVPPPSPTPTPTPSPSPTPTPGTIAVTISPTSATVAAGSNKQFTGTVTGTTNTAIIWQVNGVQGGSAATGIISSSGLYSAPACPPASVTVTARSYYDTTKFANANVTLTSGTAASGFYVSTSGSDSNSGSACSPWRTLQHAANAAGAGATVHVLPGTYTQDNLTFNNSGTSSARIRFISDQKWGALIRSTSSYTVLRMNGSYTDLIGFDLAGDSNSCLGIADWGSNNRVISNQVHNVPARSTVCGSNGGAGIDHASFTGSNDDTIGNVVHDIGSWPTLDQRVHGIYHSNAGGHVWNNVVYHCAGFGLHFYHAATAVTVSGNTVFNNVYGGVYIDGTSNMLVTDNIVVHNTQWGIIEEYGTIGSNDRYYNNLVYANGSGNIALASQSVQSGTILADPQFVNYTGGSDGNYTLKSTSPARDHGVSSGAPTYDVDGGPRPINSIWDLGAHEYGTTPGIWPWN
jgi:pectate disaccharide-lyase